MPSFEWNKIIASVLTAIIIAQVASILGSMLVRPRELAKPVFAIPIQTAATTATAKKAAPPPIGLLLAKADPKKGAQLVSACKACHSFSKGGPNKLGPNLWNIVGSPMAVDRAGFAFSSALEKKEKGKPVTPQLLNVWLSNPQKMVPGTKMTFAGISNPQKRADVIAYLATLSPGGLGAERALAKKLAAATPKPAAPAAAPAKPGAQPATPGAPNLQALLAKANPKQGKQEAQVCTACHTLKKGQPNAVGPNLFGVVGIPMATDRNGYAFSSALKKKEKGKKITPELLDVWLANPQKMVPGTKMTFAGVKNPQKRADVISYLLTLK